MPHLKLLIQMQNTYILTVISTDRAVKLNRVRGATGHMALVRTKGEACNVTVREYNILEISV